MIPSLILYALGAVLMVCALALNNDGAPEDRQMPGRGIVAFAIGWPLLVVALLVAEAILLPGKLRDIRAEMRSK